MEMHALRKHLERRHRKRADLARVIAFVLGLAVLGYGGVTVLQHAAASRAALPRLTFESHRVDHGSSADSVEAQAPSGTANAAAPAASTPKPMTRDFDYFPDHYVNGATKIDEPIATF